MLRCCAGICGGNAPAGTAGVNVKSVTKPALRLDEPEVVEPTVDFLTERFGMKLAPPGSDTPVALVSPNFRENIHRLLVLLPTAGAPFGEWDVDLPDSRGASVPLLRWAEANDYAVAIFSSAALQANPAEALDRILSGSPTRLVAILVAARGALELLHAALEPVHELLFGRIRLVAMPWEGAVPDSVSPGLASTLPSQPQSLRSHLRHVQMQWPDEWALLMPGLMRQRLFEMLREREETWQAQEANKYMGLRNLKENDIPGLRRLGVDQRVARLNRDRDTDELSRLIDKHSSATGNGAAAEDEEEPGVD